MFYTRVNKIKVFNNREGFLGLFNRDELQIYSLVRAELQIYNLVSNPTNMSGLWRIDDFSGQPKVLPSPILLKTKDLLDLSDKKRKEKLLEAVLTESERFSQCQSLEINEVKDDQSLLFGEAGLALYQSDYIPDILDIQLWVIESHNDIREFVTNADSVLESEAFNGLLGALKTASTVSNPVINSIIFVDGVVTQLLRKKLLANKDDLVGYWQASLTRGEHFPHGVRDRQNTPDITGNILVDYTLFGFEDDVFSTSDDDNDDPDKYFVEPKESVDLTKSKESKEEEPLEGNREIADVMNFKF
jgi:hypothetical protein